MRDERGYAAQLRATGSLVHNITNYVVMNNTANALLAAGASPAMVHAVDEVEEFVAISQALVVNIGTLSPAWAEAMRLAAGRARRGYPVSARPGGRGRDALPHGGRRRVGTARPDRRPGQRVLRSWRSRGPWARSATATLMMARVTGLGCTASALVGAALAVAAGDPFGATVAALAALGVAGEMAVEGAAGPGSLHFRLIDALYTLDEEMLRRRVQVELVA